MTYRHVCVLKVQIVRNRLRYGNQVSRVENPLCRALVSPFLPVIPENSHSYQIDSRKSFSSVKKCSPVSDQCGGEKLHLPTRCDMSQQHIQIYW